MIQSLRIENFALIDAVDIRFNSGFTVITGETGSGKSILLNALNLILGERANFSVIGNKSDKTIVEADVAIKGFGLEAFFEENELDFFENTIVRREIYRQGRSRAFINDTPVQLGVLKAFSSQLIHIHSQYNTLELKDTNFQLKVLDVLAGTVDERKSFHAEMQDFLWKQRNLNEKKNILSNSIAQEDYNSFQLNELQELRLDERDYAQIESESKKIENLEEIRAGLSEIAGLAGHDEGALDLLNRLLAQLQRKKDLDPQLNELYNRIKSTTVELEDIVREAERSLDTSDVDPRKMDELVALIDTYNRILQKHSATTQEELVALMNELAITSEGNEQLKQEIAALEQSIEVLQQSLTDKANKLHNKRLQAIPQIEQKIKDTLNELKLNNTEVLFKLAQEDHLGSYGNSSLEILFSPNVGIEPVAIHQAASGGELSRVMLALQSLMSSQIQLRTMLFDEIDTGVSGDVAQKMGQTLKNMGETMQVIAITHLPQVAAKGGQHLKVSKSVEKGVTTTFVHELSMNDRVVETARLMSGDQINDAALENAKALMQ